MDGVVSLQNFVTARLVGLAEGEMSETRSVLFKGNAAANSAGVGLRLSIVTASTEHRSPYRRSPQRIRPHHRSLPVSRCLLQQWYDLQTAVCSAHLFFVIHPFLTFIVVFLFTLKATDQSTLIDPHKTSNNAQADDTPSG